MKKVLCCLSPPLLLLLAACGDGHFTMNDFHRLEKIDSHVHVNSAGTALMEQAQADNFKLLTINVDYPDFPPAAEQLGLAVSHEQAHPDRIAFAATFLMQGWNESNWQVKTLRHLDEAIAQGAVAVKTWKNIGMDELAIFLDRFLNAVVDMAARMGQIQYQSSRDREKVRSFLVKYQERILYATDLTQAPEANPEEFKKEAHEKWLADWKYLNMDSIMTVPQLDHSFQGLALPKKVVEKIYRLNAEKTFPTAWQK
ncbi:MAG: hypothetical protein ACREOO_29795 [bacterium]